MQENGRKQIKIENIKIKPVSKETTVMKIIVSACVALEKGQQPFTTVKSSSFDMLANCFLVNFNLIILDEMPPLILLLKDN